MLCSTLTKQHRKFFKICRTSCNNKRFNTNGETIRMIAARSLPIQGNTKVWTLVPDRDSKPSSQFPSGLLTMRSVHTVHCQNRHPQISRQQKMRGVLIRGGVVPNQEGNVPSCSLPSLPPWTHGDSANRLPDCFPLLRCTCIWRTWHMS
jgi:hypothetical protein